MVRVWKLDYADVEKKPTLDQKFKFSYKERKWRWNLKSGGLKSYSIGWFFFLQFSRSLKLRNRAKPP
jgi:hypothetical protein